MAKKKKIEELDMTKKYSLEIVEIGCRAQYDYDGGDWLAPLGTRNTVAKLDLTKYPSLKGMIEEIIELENRVEQVNNLKQAAKAFIDG